MQDRYAGDIGDYVKLALLRTLSIGRKLGVAWYLYPDENHNSDGRHTVYLGQSERWRHLDPTLFDTLADIALTARSVSALERCLGEQVTFAPEVIATVGLAAGKRSEERRQWFEVTLEALRSCEVVFADPDNGLTDDAEHRRRQKAFGKQMPLSEAQALAAGRTAVVYHHNTHRKGGHDAEVDHWLGQLGEDAFAVRATAYSCRTFFVLNPDAEIRDRAEAFCQRWRHHKVKLHLHPSTRQGAPLQRRHSSPGSTDLSSMSAIPQVKSMKDIRDASIQEIEEAELTSIQRQRLSRLQEFLVAHGADEELLEAVEQAIEDNDHMGASDLEALIERGNLQTGEA